MYFNNVEKFKIEEKIKENEKIYGHINEKDVETLKEHMELSNTYFLKLFKEKKLQCIFENFEKVFLKSRNQEDIRLFKELILNTIYCHDLGKINCNFQYIKMKNNNFKNKVGLRFNNSNHSLLSSILYIDYFIKRIKDNKKLDKKGTLILFIILNSYIISRHHSGLKCDFIGFKSKFQKGNEGYNLFTTELDIFMENYKEELFFNKENNFLKKIFHIGLSELKKYKNDSDIYLCIYIYERFMLSILLSCDYYSTSQFKNKEEIKEIGTLNNIEEIYNEYKNTEIYKSIEQYKKNPYKGDLNQVKDMNILRDELFLEAEEELLKNLHNNIFYLEAPTGSGKSNVGFNLTFKLVEGDKNLNKIFYVYPYNTLVEQNKNNIENIFKNNSKVLNKIAVINSIFPIKEELKKKEKEENEEKVNYEESLIDRQFLHYPIILTTHVSLFNFLFGITKDDLFPLVHLSNSVVILDEIQSYKNSIWSEIIMFLNSYSKLLNIKFIIMSATLPQLDKLLDNNKGFVKLIKDRKKYFNNPIFKNRVKLDFSLLEEECNLQILKGHIIKNYKSSSQNILVEFINKSTAYEFFRILKESNEKEQLNKSIELITGDDNSLERNRIIKKIKSEKNIILVATQVIEAGVDIDMDIGYKDISIFDSEEQFLGRINRSCKKSQAIVYFFNIDNGALIYKNDCRKEKSLTLINEKIRELLVNKEFDVFYELVLKILKEKGEKLNSDNIKAFVNNEIGNLKFSNIKDKMKLIDDDKIQFSIFLSRNITLENGQVLNGEEIWEQYKESLKNNQWSYAQKIIELSKITSKLNYFIYKVKNNDFIYDDKIGDLYFIENGSEYFTDGKFDKNKWQQQSNFSII